MGALNNSMWNVAAGSSFTPTTKGIFAFGAIDGGTNTAISNLVSSSGVVASDVAGVGTTQRARAACSYGGDKGIYCFGQEASARTTIINLVSNSGVVASDSSGAGTGTNGGSATSYGVGTGIKAYGFTSSALNESNLISDSGVVASSITGVGTQRWQTPG